MRAVKRININGLQMDGEYPLFYRPLFGHDTCGSPGQREVAAKGFVDHCIGSNGNVVAQYHGTEYFGTGSDIDIVAQVRDSVVVAEAGGGVQTAVASDVCVGVNHDGAVVHDAQSRPEDVLGYGESKACGQAMVDDFKKQ